MGPRESRPDSDHLFEAHVQRLGVYFGLKLLKGMALGNRNKNGERMGKLKNGIHELDVDFKFW